MVLDRTVAPEFRSPEKFDLIKAQTTKLSNGVAFHSLTSGEQPIVRLEMVFHAGTWYENTPLASLFTTKMFGEGTESRTAKQLSEAFAYYGAFVEYNHGVDRLNLTLYTLNKDLIQLLPVVKDILFNLRIPEENLENQKRISLQTLKVSKEKTSFLATNAFKAALYGSASPYGLVQTEEAISSLNRAVLEEFYAGHVTADKLEIFISGGITPAEKDLVARYFEGNDWRRGTNSPSVIVNTNTQDKKVLLEKEGAIQSTIRLGATTIQRSHADYFNLVVLNEILGGYFGSRLMKNIREEKGLTYGIGSSIVQMQHGAHFVIGTDVKRELTQLAIDEIYKEIEVLKTEAVGEEELSTVKNFMLGSFMGSVNTPFSLMDKFKTIHYAGLEYDYFDRYVDSLKSVTSDIILETAQKYYNTENFTQVVAGGF